MTTTVPLDQHPTDADREAGLAVINRLMPFFATGVRALDDDELTSESARLKCLPKSPVIRTMRAIVDGERATRAAGRG